MVKDSDKSFKKKPGYFSLFCPVFGRKYFKDQDDLVVIFDFAGFHKNHYGYSYVEFALMFVNGELEQGKFVSNQKTYNYKFPSLETGSYFQGSVKFKIKDLVEKLKITQGLYKIKLFVYDKVAGKSVVKEYCRPIIILSVESLKKLTKE